MPRNRNKSFSKSTPASLLPRFAFTARRAVLPLPTDFKCRWLWSALKSGAQSLRLSDNSKGSHKALITHCEPCLYSCHFGCHKILRQPCRRKPVLRLCTCTLLRSRLGESLTLSRPTCKYQAGHTEHAAGNSRVRLLDVKQYS